jgi:kojibiose phosphorylase
MDDSNRASTWRVSETSFNPERQHHLETILTQGNGYLGTRGTFEERYPGDRQATLIHGIWDDIPIAFTELVNAPDWTALEVRVDGQRFAMDQGVVEDYSRYLDLQNGLLVRYLHWTPPGDKPSIDLTFERFASLADPHLLFVRLRMQAFDRTASLEIRSWLNAHVENEGRLHWEHILHDSSPDKASLHVRTHTTQKSLAMSTHTVVHHGGDGEVVKQCLSDSPGQVVHTALEAGQELILDKFVSVFTSRDVDDPLTASQAKVDEAIGIGYESLRQANDEAWSNFWADSDVIIEGDDEAQLAIRHALHQLRIAAPSTDERVSIGAKTLSGFGYKGHVFWDTEIFGLPFFMYTQPHLARNMLMYRWHTLEGARRKAAENGFSGAQFAWESAETGDEVTPRWVPDSKDPTKMIRIWPGDIEIHISADIAYSIWQYWRVTGDDAFMRSYGAPLILETALFWGDRAEPENDRYAIRDVIGPDEYHDHIDNNAYTNGMVKWHLERALDLHEWLGRISPEELAHIP